MANLTIHIPKAKAGPRDQPITQDVADFLRKYLVESVPADTKWLFPSAINQKTKQPMSKSGHTVAIQKPFRLAAIEAKLDPAVVVRHTLRHTAITHAVQAGIDLPMVKKISGHKTLSMVVRYAHQNHDHIQAAMDKMQARMEPKAA